MKVILSESEQMSGFWAVDVINAVKGIKIAIPSTGNKAAEGSGSSGVLKEAIQEVRKAGVIPIQQVVAPQVIERIAIPKVPKATVMKLPPSQEELVASKKLEDIISMVPLSGLALLAFIL